MKKRSIVYFSVAALAFGLLCGCGNQKQEKETTSASSGQVQETTSASNGQVQETATAAGGQQGETVSLADGVYLAEFQTDSGMFKVNETKDGKGILEVADGKMTIHISLASKKIVNLYPGLAKDAEQDGAVLLQPTIDEITYPDGLKEEVHGFDVPVQVLDQEFDLALIGTKGTWYDHKVKVTNPVVMEETSNEPKAETGQEHSEDTSKDENAETSKDENAETSKDENAETSQQQAGTALSDGTYSVELTFEGGSGKAKILPTATLTVQGETMTARVQWNSPNYDYMLVDGEKYLPVNTEGDSAFEIPVKAFDEKLTVIGDTVAMSKPHEITYTITFRSDTLKEV